MKPEVPLLAIVTPVTVKLSPSASVGAFLPPMTWNVIVSPNEAPSVRSAAMGGVFTTWLKPWVLVR